MGDLEIVKLKPDEWQQYKNLRLEALQQDPEAFGELYDEIKSRPEEEWRTNLEQGFEQKDKWMLFAMLNGKLVGMMGGYIINPGDIVKLTNVFVLKDARGKGVAKKLLLSLLDSFKSNPNAKKVKAKVFTSQDAAIALYKSCGFETVDQITEHWPDGRTHETFVMEKYINHE